MSHSKNKSNNAKKGKQQEKEDFEKTHVIQWDVPLSQFYVDRRLYHPKPTLWSPIATVHTNRLTLRWQLSLEQGREDTRCYLHHQTPEIPNQGVNFTVSAIRHDGSEASLSAAVRGALNYAAGLRYGKSDTDPNAILENPSDETESKQKRWNLFAACGPPSSSHSSQQSWLQSARYNLTGVEKLIWKNDTVKIRVLIGISNHLWSPRRIMDHKIRDWKAEDLRQGNEVGLIGECLWSQVKYLPPGNEPVPPNTDLILVCPTGERIAAHKSVVAAFSSSFRQLALAGGQAESGPGDGRFGGEITMTSSGIGAPALWEMLHFIYLRSISPEFYKAPLNEILEAVHIFQLPKVLSFEVEKVFTQIMDLKNRDKMKILAQKYGLNIVLNMVKKAERDVGEYAAEFDVAERGLVANLQETQSAVPHES